MYKKVIEIFACLILGSVLAVPSRGIAVEIKGRISFKPRLSARQHPDKIVRRIQISG